MQRVDGMNEPKYTMNLSLNVLNHLGINLYSNVPSVIAEVIANSWDAGATRVDIMFGKESVTIVDNGNGMNKEDVNNRYLYVGYQKREDTSEMPRGRVPMGRKGIGKLSLFSIAEKIFVYSKKGSEKNALLMDVDKIKREIKAERPDQAKPYHPDAVDFDKEILTHDTGTAIKIENLKKRITTMTADGLKKRLARRFTILEHDDFDVYINGDKVTYADRDYFHKARFLFQYGEENYSTHCKNLEKDDKGNQLSFIRPHRFDDKGKEKKDGECQIKGWIGVAHRSNDLDSDEKGAADDNLNNIVIVVRGKVAQEDILHEFRMGGLITKFLYGEIQADFLDADGDEDITTSSRQKIVEDSPRYRALKSFLKRELVHIWTETNTLKEKKGVQIALNFHPLMRKWYEDLGSSYLQKKANRLFGAIEKIFVDEEGRKLHYINGILAFEQMKMDDALDQLDDIEEDQWEAMLKVFRSIDDIEAARYYEITNGRLKKIDELRKVIHLDEKERKIQEYIFDNLWLLDPAWERATEDASMEREIQMVIKDNENKETDKVKKMRTDIQYKKVSGEHMIIELKRASVRLKKTEIENQLNAYIEAVRSNLINIGRGDEPIKGVCIVGAHSNSWDRNKDPASLDHYGIRVMTYGELIENARSAYSKYLAKRDNLGTLRDLLREIRKI